MEKLKPYLRKLDQNLDRVAVGVFMALTAAVIFLWNSEKSGSPDEVPKDPAAAEMTDHMKDNDSYSDVVSSLAPEGVMYQEQALTEGHRYFELVQFSDFSHLEATDEAEILAEAERRLETAKTIFENAKAIEDDRRKRDNLERALRLCDQSIQVWSAQQGVDPERARQLREEIVAELDAVKEILGDEEAE